MARLIGHFTFGLMFDLMIRDHTRDFILHDTEYPYRDLVLVFKKHQTQTDTFDFHQLVFFLWYC